MIDPIALPTEQWSGIVNENIKIVANKLVNLMERKMFKSGDFTITFEYFDYTNNPHQVGHDAYASHAVVCQIYDKYYDVTVRDVAYCSVNDKYDEQLGEEIALERAIDLLSIDMELQNDIWDAYYG